MHRNHNFVRVLERCFPWVAASGVHARRSAFGGFPTSLNVHLAFFISRTTCGHVATTRKGKRRRRVGCLQGMAAGARPALQPCPPHCPRQPRMPALAPSDAGSRRRRRGPRWPHLKDGRPQGLLRLQRSTRTTMMMRIFCFQPPLLRKSRAAAVAALQEATESLLATMTTATMTTLPCWPRWNRRRRKWAMILRQQQRLHRTSLQMARRATCPVQLYPWRWRALQASGSR